MYTYAYVHMHATVYMYIHIFIYICILQLSMIVRFSCSCTCTCNCKHIMFIMLLLPFHFFKFLSLRVEFLLTTDSGYPRDEEVTLFTLANPERSLRFYTHWSAPPVSALACSGGPRKMSQSPVSRNSNIERRMDRPRAVVGVIRGVA